LLFVVVEGRMEAVDAIIAAAVRGDLVEVRRWLAADPGLAAKSNMFGSTAIHAAHHSGHAEVTQVLWAASGARLDVFMAAQLGDVEQLRRMLDEDPSLVRQVNERGATALHEACYWGGIAEATLLLDRGADVDAITTDAFLQIAPLGAAVATPDVPNPSQHEAVVLALVELLLARGANVNGRRRDGMTALHSAAYRGHLDVMRRLIAGGADATLRAYDIGAHAGESPLDTALAQGQQAAADLLRLAQ
jgi:ankyrin repeat protein